MNSSISTESVSNLPASKLAYSQVKTYPARVITFKGRKLAVRATVRYDDQCKNGHNSFSITGEATTPGESWEQGSSGCIHEEIAAAFPELRPFIKWHLTSSDGPMYYVANTVYHASNRDHWGLLKGEFEQHKSHGNQNGGVAGVPNWELVIPERQTRDVYSVEKPVPVVCEWRASGITGEGKERELDHARSCAVWPEATDAELMQEPEALKAVLLARLPALMAEFKRDVESLGFVY